MSKSTPEQQGDKAGRSYEEIVKDAAGILMDGVMDRFNHIKGKVSDSVPKISRFRPFQAGEMPDKDKD